MAAIPPIWPRWSSIAGSITWRSAVSFCLASITDLLGRLAGGDVATRVAGQHDGDGEFVAAHDGSAQLGPAVDDSGEGRHDVVKLAVAEAPVLGHVGIAQGVGGATAEGAQQPPHNRLVDLGGVEIEAAVVQVDFV